MTMEINAIPEAFQTKLRLAVLSALLTGEKNFRELKGITEATDGNLGAQLKKLEEAGYIAIRKAFVNNKPQTNIQPSQYPDPDQHDHPYLHHALADLIACLFYLLIKLNKQKHITSQNQAPSAPPEYPGCGMSISGQIQDHIGNLL